MGIDIVTLLPDDVSGYAKLYKENGLRIIKGEWSLPITKPWHVKKKIKEINSVIKNEKEDYIDALKQVLEKHADVVPMIIRNAWDCSEKFSLKKIVSIFTSGGDMVVIGPRILLVQYLPLYNEQQRKRHCVRPGITGRIQTNGRNNISWEKKLSFDSFYVNNLSFRLDIYSFKNC